MVHGRIVRPRGQGSYGTGARVISVDERALADIPGARVLRKGDFIGVVAPREWDAVRAAQALVVEWENPETLPGVAALHDADAQRADHRQRGAGARRRARGVR